MAYVYVLYSKFINRFYIGSCEDIALRLDEHRSHKRANAFTKRATDWELFYLISDLGYHQSRAIEKHLKRMKSRKYLENLRCFPEIEMRLRERYRAGSSR